MIIVIFNDNSSPNGAELLEFISGVPKSCPFFRKTQFFSRYGCAMSKCPNIFMGS